MELTKAEVEKIACNTRFTRHVGELVPLVEHSSLRLSCFKPSRLTILSCATIIKKKQYTILELRECSLGIKLDGYNQRASQFKQTLLMKQPLL
jgi:hypothetical protein